MISVTFERKGNFLLQVDVAGDWNGSTTTNIKINTKWLNYGLGGEKYQLIFESFDSFLR
jgi:hypothetical protein